MGADIEAGPIEHGRRCGRLQRDICRPRRGVQSEQAEACAGNCFREAAARALHVNISSNATTRQCLCHCWFAAALTSEQSGEPLGPRFDAALSRATKASKTASIHKRASIEKDFIESNL